MGQRVFEVLARAFFVAASSKQKVLSLASRRYPFCHDYDFELGGHGAIAAMVLYDRGKLDVIFICSVN